METDRELLEAAARAAGIEGCLDPIETLFIRKVDDENGVAVWDPLGDHIDAIKLESKLGIRLEYESYNGRTYAHATPPGTHQGYDELVEDGSTEAGMLAANRAIVRAAAAMWSARAA